MPYILQLTIPDGPVRQCLENDVSRLQAGAARIQLTGICFTRSATEQPCRELTYRIAVETEAEASRLAEGYAAYLTGSWAADQTAPKTDWKILAGVWSAIALLEETLPLLAV